MNKELIELLKQGTHCIEMPDNTTKEDVDLLNEIQTELVGYNPDFYGNYNYYTNGFGQVINEDNLLTIPLSSFLDQPKMISVEAVKEFIHKHVFYQDNDELIDADQLLTFLNEIK